jgi:hypothetical protein
VLLATLAVVAALLLPAQSQSKHKAIRINCVNNLKQVGLAFRLWSGDHNDRYPPSFYKNPSATLKFPDETNALRYFQLVTNALKSVKVVTCPDDNRLPTALPLPVSQAP